MAAANLALEIPAGKPQDDALVGIVQRWVQTDPQAAASWVNLFPEGELRETAMENVVKLWAKQNPQAAGAWLNSIDAGSSRDNAEQLAPTSSTTAAEWAASIGDPTLREQQLALIRKMNGSD